MTDGREVGAAVASGFQAGRHPRLASATEMNWYCIHTKPVKEGRVAAHFRDKLGVETYYPQLRQHRTIRRIRRVVTSPLFPRYLFCRVDLASSYRAIRYAPDVIDVVRLGERPAVVNHGLIADLKSWAGEAVDIFTLQPSLQTGDTVEVTDGPMRGVTAVILHASNDRDRVAILLSVLQTSAQITISRSQLRRID